MDNNYIPYGEEWKKEMNKLPKTHLLTILADALKKVSQSPLPSPSVPDDAEDFRLLEEYDMKDKLEKVITHCLTSVPQANRKSFMVNFCNSIIGSAILHHNSRYVKKLNVPDFKSTFK